MQLAGDGKMFRVGQRVHYAGVTTRIGTVQYVGPVAGHDGDWVGVDWDEGGGGKHDGSVNGVRYFTVRSENSGSFLRPHSVSAGVSFLEGLQLRYRGETTKEDEAEMYVLSTRNNRVSVEFVGKNEIEEKLSRLEDLKAVGLSYLGISSIPSDIGSITPHLKEVDLTGNLLSDWQLVAALCEGLPKLEVLNLSYNLMMPDIPSLPSFKNVRVLILNNCGISWEQVESLKLSFPAIQELHLMANKISSIKPAVTLHVQGFVHLRLINLEDNCITCWSEIIKFSQLSSLEELHLNKNNLVQIIYPNPGEINSDESSENRSRPFENLRCLLLGSNSIADLKSVDSLNLFPKLRDIRLSENPIVDPESGGIPRFVLIARLAKIEILNGSEVSPRERKESEIRYVRLVMSKRQSDNPVDVKQLHPRFEELKQLHGIDEKPTAVTSDKGNMASGLISVTLECVGASMGEKPPITKTLPATTTVGKLKFLCVSFFKLKSVKPKLFLKEKDSPLPMLLDEDNASLMEIGIPVRCTILVDEEK